MRELISEIEQRLDEPTAKGLAQAVSVAVREGALPAGSRLPPIREIARELALSPTTVNAAWRVLSRAGTIVTGGRRGTRITEVNAPREGRYRQAIDRHDNHFDLDLSTGVPDLRLLPSLTSALRELTTAGTPASYLDDPVLPELRKHLTDVWPYPPPALAVVDGAMDGLELIIRSHLTFGDRVLVENPTFPPLLDLLDASGMVVEGIPIDADGMLPDALEAALQRPARALFVQPRAQNPTGVCLSEDRLRQLRTALSASGLLVVEDDSAGELSTAPDVSFGTFFPERTIRVRSYSKSHGPDLRLAAMSGPEDLIGQVQHLRQLGQGWSSRLLQRLLLNLLTDEGAQHQVTAARTEYARRRAQFTENLARAGVPTLGSEGLNVWVPVHDEAAAVMYLAVHGIAVAPGRPFVLDETSSPHVRITVGLVEDVSALSTLVADAAHASTRRRNSR